MSSMRTPVRFLIALALAAPRLEDEQVRSLRDLLEESAAAPAEGVAPAAPVHDGPAPGGPA